MKSDRISEQSNSQQAAGQTYPHRDIAQAQETIYQFLLKIVKQETPATVLAEVKRLYLQPDKSSFGANSSCVYQIVLAGKEAEFRNTLKRSCYILINNWDLSRQYEAIQQLIQLFANPILEDQSSTIIFKRLREWLRNFTLSQDFYELKLFAAKYEERNQKNWSQRYTSYLLVPQYANSKNSEEQRQVAKNLSKRLKDRFKFDLAMYTAYAECAAAKKRSRQNPTELGDEVLRLMRKIIGKKGYFSYHSLANIFLKQTEHVKYKAFRKGILEYLFFAGEQNRDVRDLKQKLAQKLDGLYTHHEQKIVDRALIFRTVKRIIEYLTIEKRTEPSAIFNILMSQGSALTLAIVLLKLILICPEARTHLEVCIAKLIQYYETCPEEECKSVIKFFELFNIVMTIYNENVAYNLIDMNKDDQYYSLKTRSDAYRIFSQLKEGSAAAESETPELLTSEDTTGFGSFAV